MLYIPRMISPIFGNMIYKMTKVNMFAREVVLHLHDVMKNNVILKTLSFHW